MKIIVTGSLGHIGQPLTTTLVQHGHSVTVISSNPEKKAAIEALGATAAIGTIEDADFLTATFTGADVVYTMVPPPGHVSPNMDLMAICRKTAHNFAGAIEKSGVQRVIHLSSIGAHLDKGSGLILLHHEIELILDRLSDVDITFMRPVGFYYNLFGFIPMIKSQGLMASNYGADDKAVWVAPVDIAAAIADEIVMAPVSRKVRYVASEELTCNEVAHILGTAIGKPDLPWIIIPGERMQDGLESAGLNADFAAGLVEMYAAIHSGLLEEDYYRNRPAVMGKVKMADFAREFAAVYHQ